MVKFGRQVIRMWNSNQLNNSTVAMAISLKKLREGSLGLKAFDWSSQEYFKHLSNKKLISWGDHDELFMQCFFSRFVVRWFIISVVHARLCHVIFTTFELWGIVKPNCLILCTCFDRNKCCTEIRTPDLSLKSFYSITPCHNWKR